MQTVCRRILSLSLRSSSSSVSASCRRHMSSDSSNYADFKAVTVMKPSDHVINVELNRPEKMNAMNNVMWGEIGQVFRTIDKVNSSNLTPSNIQSIEIICCPERILKNMKFVFTLNILFLKMHCHKNIRFCSAAHVDM